MKRNVMAVVAGVLAATVLAGAAIAQGPGNGRGAGRGQGNGMRAGMGPGARGQGAGGWWTRVAPKTPEQKAFVAKVTDLHNQVRQANMELATLRTQNAPANQIAAKTQTITALQTQLQKVIQANQVLVKQMGVPAGYGVCDGTGRNGAGFGAGMGAGRGRGAGMGAGRGNGRGLRDGTGPNPNCPLKTN